MGLPTLMATPLAVAMRAATTCSGTTAPCSWRKDTLLKTATLRRTSWASWEPCQRGK